METKLFATANGRKFRIQATSRISGKTDIIYSGLTEKQVRQYTPSLKAKCFHKYFKVAYNDSPVK